MSIEIREVRPEEHEAAGDVVAGAYLALPGRHTSGGYERELRDVAARVQGAVVLVAVEDGEVLGAVTYVPDPASPYAELLQPGEAGLRMLGVAPHAQARGIGRALVAACIARARAEGRVRLVLHSTPWMLAAHRVYEVAGFRRAPERDWAPVPEVPLLGYVLELGAVVPPMVAEPALGELPLR